MADMKTEVRYDDTTGEGVGQTILLSCKRTMVKDTTDDLRVANTTSRVEEGFGKQLSETSREKGVSIIDACMIEGDKACEVDMIKEVATKDDIESEVAMNESMADGRGKTLPTLIPEISAVVFENQRETGEAGGGGKKGKVRSQFRWKMIRTGLRSERKPTRKGVGSVNTESA